MSETAQLLGSLSDGINSRLAFRRDKLIDAIHAVVGQANRSGNLNSSGIAFAVARPFGEEVQQRAELVCSYLKEARMDWSPRQLLDEEAAIRSTVIELFKKNLSDASTLAAQIGTISQKRTQGGTWAGVAVSFDNETNAASENAVRMVQSTISGIVQAARTQIQAKGPIDRPLFMQVFSGPVGAVAQGRASIGSVMQTNSPDMHNQLTELAKLIADARAELGAEGANETAAALAVVQAESESKTPDLGVVKAGLSECAVSLNAQGAGLPVGRFSLSVSVKAVAA